MTSYLGGHSLTGNDLGARDVSPEIDREAIRELAHGWSTLARELLAVQSDLDQQRRRLESETWSGTRAEAYRRHVALVAADLDQAVASLLQGGRDLEQIANESTGPHLLDDPGYGTAAAPASILTSDSSRAGEATLPVEPPTHSPGYPDTGPGEPSLHRQIALITTRLTIALQTVDQSWTRLTDSPWFHGAVDRPGLIGRPFTPPSATDPVPGPISPQIR